jgi:molybdopterin-guanine dinucleotide biosynthesis protein A
MKMNALVLAGGKLSSEDPLFAEGKHRSRSLVEIHGKPMVQWVVDALDAAGSVREIYVIGLPADQGLKATKPIHYLPDSGGIFENIRDGILRSAADYPAQPKVIIASSDIPAVKPEMIDWVADQVAADLSPLIYYNVVPQAVMEKRFPNAKRSYVHFKDIAICGGDLNVLDKDLFAVDRPIWKKLAEARKSPLKQASLLGFENVILVGLRLVTLKTAVRKVCRKLSLEARALVCPHAEIAMDADKPHQLEILRADLEDQF